jgi:hypothetical protein
MDRHERFFSSVKSKQPEIQRAFLAVQISRRFARFRGYLLILERQVRPAHHPNPIDDWKIDD